MNASSAADGRRRASRTAVGLCALLALTGSLTTSCAPSAEYDPAAACVWMAEMPTEAARHGQTAILVDSSASVRGTKPSAEGVDYTDAISPLLAKMIERGDTVSVGTFGGNSGKVTWTARKQSAAWKASDPNPGNQQENRDAAAECLTGHVAEAESKLPAHGGTDVLAAMAAGAAGLGDADGRERRLLVLTDGLSTTGCADLREAGFRDEPEIKAIARVCDAREEIPALREVDVTFVGLAQSATDTPAAKPAQRNWLAELWTTLCEEGGGSCTVQDTPVDTAAAPSGKDPAPAEPVVRYGEDGVRTYSLPGAALFDTNSSRVRPKAVPMLTDIAVSARTLDLDRVVVKGYVDPRGTSGNNKQLSQARADAVRDVLVDLGVSPVEAEGEGLARDCPEESGSAGTSDEERLQCRRRVDIEIIEK
ncbi:OmpA family protein [Streptomyces spongiae]|uniref:OmpA family protein n=1 Tax=Streptomyces spongiae TaxID=565072 RepID=A0A5N8XG16_9ACTN|nr:OmpA family protein [Streptomyces spongiae]MPY57495.1 OmpA family protein [Streptomyces spongiae]